MYTPAFATSLQERDCSVMSNAYDDDDMEEAPPSWWGAEVQNGGKPVPFVPPPIEAKLHLSQVLLSSITSMKSH